MKIRLLVLFLGLILVGCGGEQGEQVQFINAADPALLSKLGISDHDWSQIKRLASGQKEFVIKDAGKAATNVIEVELKKPDDARNDQGGPTERYERQAAGWVKQTDFQGNWAVASPPFTTSVRMTGDIPSWIGLPLAILVLGGWPLFFFARFRWRKRGSIRASLLITVLPSVAVLWLGASISDIAYVLSRHGGFVRGTISALMLALVWLTPYVILVIWAVGALRRRHETS